MADDFNFEDLLKKLEDEISYLKTNNKKLEKSKKSTEESLNDVFTKIKELKIKFNIISHNLDHNWYDEFVVHFNKIKKIEQEKIYLENRCANYLSEIEKLKENKIEKETNNVLETLPLMCEVVLVWTGELWLSAFVLESHQKMWRFTTGLLVPIEIYPYWMSMPTPP